MRVASHFATTPRASVWSSDSAAATSENVAYRERMSISERAAHREESKSSRGAPDSEAAAAPTAPLRES